MLNKLILGLFVLSSFALPILPKTAAAEENGLVFYESFDNLASIQANNGYCGSNTNTPCDGTSNIDFVPGLDGNAVQFGIEPVNFMGPIEYHGISLYSGTGTIEYWAKPTNLGSLYNSDIYSGFKLGLYNYGEYVKALYQYNGDYLLTAPENPLGWHKVGITWDNSHLLFYLDDKVLEIFPQNYPSPGTLRVGNPWISEPCYDAIDNLKAYSTAKTQEQIIQEYRDRVPDQRPVINSFSPQTEINLAIGQNQTFSVNASDPASLPLTYVWFVSGVQQLLQTSSSFVFSPSQNKEYPIKVIVSNGQYSAIKEWHVNPPNFEFMKSMNYVSWWIDQYSSPDSDNYLRELQSDNVKWVSILATQYQDSVNSNTIYPVESKTPSDASLVHAIQQAKSLGYKVMLKPHVDPLSGSRTDIIMQSESDWTSWFNSYKTFINHYAALAQNNNVDLFIPGTELKGTSAREGDWRSVIDGVRQRYSGPLVYAANWDEYTAVPWWDAMDYIGVDAYFPLTQKADPTIHELLQAWQPISQALEQFSIQNSKKLLFTEIGYQSADGTNTHPAWSGGAIDLQEQADCYEAFLKTFSNASWVQGISWWNWEAWGDQGGPTDTDFTPRHKPAEIILRGKWGNMLQNPGFEIKNFGSEAYWNPQNMILNKWYLHQGGGVVKQVSIAKSGSYGLQVSDASATYVSDASQITEVIPGKYYHASAWAKRPIAGSGQILYLKFLDINKQLIKEYTTVFNGASWENKGITGLAPVNVKYAQVILYSYVQGKSTFYWDDVSLVQTDNLVSNGSFEEDYFFYRPYWSFNEIEPGKWYLHVGGGNIAPSTNDAHTGIKSLYINDTSASYTGDASQIIAARPNTFYNLSAYAKKISGGNVLVYLNYLDSSKNKISGTTNYFSSTSWDNKTITSTSPANTTYIQIILYSTVSGKSAFYWDDVVLKEQ